MRTNWMECLKTALHTDWECMCSSKLDPSLWPRNHSPIKWGKIHNVHGCKRQSQGWKSCLPALHLVWLVCKAANPEKRRQGKHQRTPWAGKYGHWVSRLWAWTTVFRFGILIYQLLAALKPSSLFTSSRIVSTWLSWCCPHPSCPVPQEPFIVGTCHDHCKSVCLWASMLPGHSTLVAAMVFHPFYSVFTGISPCFKAPDNPA